MTLYQSTSDKENEQMVKSVGETLISAIVDNDQQRMLDTLFASSSMGLEYLDSYENTPLLVASYLGRSDLVRILLQHGANYKRINLYGQNALTMATYSGDKLTCEELLRAWPYGCYNTRCMLSPLCVAALQGNVDMVQFYMARDRDLPTMDTNKCKTESIHGVCPLAIAVERADDAIIRLLTDEHVGHI